MHAVNAEKFPSRDIRDKDSGADIYFGSDFEKKRFVQILPYSDWPQIDFILPDTLTQHWFQLRALLSVFNCSVPYSVRIEGRIWPI